MYISLWLCVFMTDDIYLIAMTWKRSNNIRKRIDKRRGCKMPKKYC
jgi:hypothetical protein